VCFFPSLFFAWCGISDPLDFVLTCPVRFSTESLLYPLSSSSPNANPQAGGPQRRPPTPALERAGDRPPITQRRASHTPLPRASNQTLLPHHKQKELRQLEQFNPRRRFCYRMETRTHPDAPKSTRFPSPSRFSRFDPFLISSLFLSRVRTDFGRVTVPSTHTIQRASPSL
jgi:hypothetical protein